MAVPLFPFLVGAAVGAAALYVLREGLPAGLRRKGAEVTGDAEAPPATVEEAEDKPAPAKRQRRPAARKPKASGGSSPAK